jgi:hypothetical protein
VAVLSVFWLAGGSMHGGSERQCAVKNPCLIPPLLFDKCLSGHSRYRSIDCQDLNSPPIESLPIRRAGSFHNLRTMDPHGPDQPEPTRFLLMNPTNVPLRMHHSLQSFGNHPLHHQPLAIGTFWYQGSVHPSGSGQRIPNNQGIVRTTKYLVS